MQKSFLSFLGEIGFAGLRRLSAKSDIHLCRERATGRLMVAKLWPDALMKCAEREAKALSALGEIGLAPRLHVALDSEFGPFLLHQYVSGQTLYEVERQPKLVEQITPKLKELVGAIHANGWVHRDLTPANVVVSDSTRLSGGSTIRVVLVDWDLSEQIAKQDSRSFSPKGTPGFSMAQTSKDLIQQDLEAMERIIAFLKGPSAPADDKVRSRPWWTGLFSAQP
jgi:serine/threonine protein kinase